MPNKRYKPEQIVNLLRQVEVEIANGKTTPQAARDAEITTQTYYLAKGIRWVKVGPSEAAEGAGERKQPVEAVGG